MRLCLIREVPIGKYPPRSEMDIQNERNGIPIQNQEKNPDYQSKPVLQTRWMD